jgi:hypothetical protein
MPVAPCVARKKKQSDILKFLNGAQALWHTSKGKYITIIHRPLVCPDRSQQVYEQAR